MEPTAIDAIPSGMLFADWIAQRGCAKSTAYRMRSELGITPERRRRGAVVETWLSQEDADLMTDYAEALSRGLSTAEALAAVGRGGALVESDGRAMLVPMEPDGPPAAGPMDSDGTGEVERLRARLAALRDAVELGAPLTTREAEILLGARPGGSVVVRGRIVAMREVREDGRPFQNRWTLELSG
jgi:hypothetical protein